MTRYGNRVTCVTIRFIVLPVRLLLVVLRKRDRTPVWVALARLMLALWLTPCLLIPLLVWIYFRLLNGFRRTLLAMGLVLIG